MTEMPRSRPRGKKKSAARSNKTRNSVSVGNRNNMSHSDFYGGAASDGTPHRYSKIRSVNPGSSSYESWKRSQKHSKKNLRNRSTKRRSVGKHFLWGKFLSTILVALVIIFLASFIFSSGVRNAVVEGVYTFIYNHTHDDPQLAENNEQNDDEKGIIYTTIDMTKDDINRGNLILVNGDNAYDFEANEQDIDLVNIADEGHSSFSTVYDDLQVSSVMMNALNNMFDGFYNATGNSSVCIISAYRTYDYQSSLYDSKVDEVGQEKADTWAAKAGYSEHHTGLAVDIGIANGDGAETFNLDGDYAWIAQNCHKYGLVNRYDESKQDLTGIMDEPWHYRYVGIPHAYVMYNKNLCLEEYIESLKYYSYKGDHLAVTVDDGTTYEIYYVNSSFRSGVPVPKNYDYEISGNNVDGFVVTVDMTTRTGSEEE